MSQVDVIVPCYNYGRFLRDCVTSALSQEGVEVRVLILDDASSDETPEIGTILAAKDHRIEYRPHAVNQGHIATYNEGLAWSDGDYLLVLSADDMLTPGALWRAARLMDAHPRVGFVYGRAITTSDPAQEHVKVPADYYWHVMDGDEFIETSCKVYNNMVPTPTAVVRTSLQRRIGGYRKELTHTGDMEMWLRLAAYAEVGVIDADQAFYRQHSTNMSKGYSGLREVLQSRLAFDAFFAECCPLVRNWERHREVAYHGLGQEAFWAANDAFIAGASEECYALLELARELHPRLRRTWGWWRFGCKRLLGRRLSSVLRGCLRRHAPRWNT